eukprot:365154-Chlamydomonas_euryale.AAC.2
MATEPPTSGPRHARFGRAAVRRGGEEGGSGRGGWALYWATSGGVLPASPIAERLPKGGSPLPAAPHNTKPVSTRRAVPVLAVPARSALRPRT